MDKYYLDIIEQMGLTIPDKDQAIVHVYKNGKLIDTIDMNKNDFSYDKISIEEGWESIFVNDLNGFYISAFNKSYNSIFSVCIHSLRDFNNLGFQIDLIPAHSDSRDEDLIAEINVRPYLSKDEFVMEEFWFKIFPDHGELCVVKYGRSAVRTEVALDECTVGNIIISIINYVNSTKLADEEEIQKGLAMIVPALRTGISEMLEFCKENNNKKTK